MKPILVIMMLFLSLPILADENRPKFRFMGADDISAWYELAITKSILEDANRMQFKVLLALSKAIECFDVEISTESIQHWNEYSPPTWRLNATNCVDRRIHQCEEE